jgi:hypothetical protein
MYLISHRGNIENKIEELENSPSYIDIALELGYDVEIDLWRIDGELFLGHDEPTYNIDLNWLVERKEKLWVHCKNIESLIYLTYNKIDLNYFWHDQDFATLTSKKFIWAKENKNLIDNSIAMIPDFCKINYYKCIGVCSDQIKNFKNDYEKTRH